MSIESYEKIASEITSKLKDDAVDTLVAEYTEKNAVADTKVIEWSEEIIAEAKNNPGETLVIGFSTDSMFSALRLQVKKGNLKNLHIRVNGTTYTHCVLPNGKFYSNNYQQEKSPLDVHTDLMFELL